MLTVFTAKKIITMNPSWPTGTAIAVREGRIVEVGSLESLQPWLEQHPYCIDRQFEDSVILPGLIDPHLHPMMAAVLLPMQFITAMEWRLPWETVPATVSPQAYQESLRKAAAKNETRPFFTWGYHKIWHGEMSRDLLDEIFGSRPAVVWQRSFHEVYLNSAMLELLGIDVEALRGRHQIDIDKGHFYELGLGYAINKLNPIIMATDWILEGMTRLKQLVQFGGHTTVGDMAVGLFDFEKEWQLCQQVFEQDNNPFRIISVAHANGFGVGQGELAATVSFVKNLPKRNSAHVQFGKRIKLFTDGAFFSQLAMMQSPGYIDGHLGEWLMPPDEFERIARAYWNEGFRIHVHCTGDLGCELALDVLEKLQWERPRFNHGFTIEHFGFSTPEQVDRLKLLGGSVSANVYYLRELSGAYSTVGIGTERASQMARLQSCVAQQIVTTLHSDFPMAPAMPLHNAWVACTRQNINGDVVAPQEQLSLEEGLKAITINAAKVLGIQDETGSLRAGKKADFVVLDSDPFAAGIDGLLNIAVLATVFEGQVHTKPERSGETCIPDPG